MRNCFDVVENLITTVACFRFFISPLLFIFGAIANAMSFYLFFTNKPLTRYSLYPMALCIFETITLLLNAFIDDFLGRGLYYFTKGNAYLKLDVYSLSTCQFFEFAESWSSFVAAYIMLAFGVDRVLSISIPHKFQPRCYIRATLLIQAGVILVGAALSAPIAAGAELRSENEATLESWSTHLSHNITGTLTCTFKAQEGTNYYTKVNITVITFLIPTFLLMIINCIIIGQMVKVVQRRRKLRSATGACGQKKTLFGMENSEGRAEMGRVFAYLLTSFISFAFTAPYTVVVCIRAGYDASTPPCSSSIAAELSRLFNSLKDIQYACHGYTYIFFFKFFRNRLKEISGKVRHKICCCCPRLCIHDSVLSTRREGITDNTHSTTR